MYDVPSMVGEKDGCAECKAVDSKKQELSSRFHSLYYASEDYDRKKGKGAFKKDFSAANKLMDDLLKEKTALIVNHEFQHAAHEESEAPEEEEMEHATGVPVI